VSEALRVCEIPRIPRRAYLGRLPPELLFEPGAAGELRGDQEVALSVIQRHRGAVLQIACGGGKGLIAMLAGRVLAAERPLVLIPSKLQETFHAEWAKFAQLGFRLSENVTVRSHAWLSQKKNAAALRDLAPDLLFVDEAHAFKDPKAARTRRLLSYLEEAGTAAHGGSVAFVAASGTLMARSLLDAAHLFWHALGPLSPLPRVRAGAKASTTLESWASVMDSGGQPSPVDWARVEPLVERFAPESAVREWPAARGARRVWIARKALQARRESCPGVVVSSAGEDGADASLEIYLHREPRPPAEVQEVLDVIAEGTKPDGEPFPSDAHRVMEARRASVGVWYRWDWSRVGRTEPDREWMDRRRDWAKASREELERTRQSGQGPDSEGNLWDAVEADAVAHYQHGKPARFAHLHAAWYRWARIRHRYNVDQLREHVWISAFFWRALRDRVQELERQGPVVVWYSSRAAEEALHRCGWPVYGEGSDAPQEARTCALSMERHGTGVTHLQTLFSQCVFAEWPSSGLLAEQVLARLHRPGQRGDTVSAHVYVHTDATLAAFRSAQRDAAFLELGQGPQRLRYAPILQE
jgi:hypothetical protein